MSPETTTSTTRLTFHHGLRKTARRTRISGIPHTSSV